MNIFLTGATGMIGQALYEELVKQNYRVLCGVRRRERGRTVPEGRLGRICPIGTLDGYTDFSQCLPDADVVVHLAGLAHVTNHSEEEFLNVNFRGTRNLARQAARWGVKRFVFLSSVTVSGPSGWKNGVVTEQGPEEPDTPYSRSKILAEMALRQIELETGMKVVIIRSPLVYGPGVKANFFKLLRIAGTGVPLPLGGIPNTRSLIYIDNLNHAVLTCIKHSAAEGQTFLVSDGCDLSVSQLMKKISQAMEKRACLFYCPASIFKVILTLIGKQGIYERLWGSLAVDISKIERELGWVPPVPVGTGITKTVQWYLAAKQCPEQRF